MNSWAENEACRPSVLAEFVNGKGSLDKCREEYCRQMSCCAPCPSTPQTQIVVPIYFPNPPPTPPPRNRLASIDILEEIMAGINEPGCCDIYDVTSKNSCDLPSSRAKRRHRITFQESRPPLSGTQNWPFLPLPKKQSGCCLNPCPPGGPDDCVDSDPDDEEWRENEREHGDSGTYYFNKKCGKFEPGPKPPPRPVVIVAKCSKPSACQPLQPMPCLCSCSPVHCHNPCPPMHCPCPYPPMPCPCPCPPMQYPCPCPPMQYPCPCPPMQCPCLCPPMQCPCPCPPMHCPFPCPPMHCRCPCPPMQFPCPCPPMQFPCAYPPMQCPYPCPPMHCPYSCAPCAMNCPMMNPCYPGILPYPCPFNTPAAWNPCMPSPCGSPPRTTSPCDGNSPHPTPQQPQLQSQNADRQPRKGDRNTQKNEREGKRKQRNARSTHGGTKESGTKTQEDEDDCVSGVFALTETEDDCDVSKTASTYNCETNTGSTLARTGTRDSCLEPAQRHNDEFSEPEECI